MVTTESKHVQDDPSRPPSRHTPWYARPKVYLAVAVVAMLAFAGAAAVQQHGSEPEKPGIAIAPHALITQMPTITEVPTTEATSVPTPQPTPTPLLLDLRPERVGVGETMLIWAHAPDAFSVTLEFRGGVYSLLHEGNAFWGVVGVPLDADHGTDTLTVTSHSSTGELLDRGTKAYEVIAVERPIDYLTLTVGQASVLTPEAGSRERELRAHMFAEFDRGRRWTTYFRRPTTGMMTTAFGQGRSYNNGPASSFHTGTDFATPGGTPVVAAAPGRVDWVGEMPIRGISVLIDHGAGVKTSYHHLQSTGMTNGEQVDAGQQIGTVGMTGLTTGPHLHWELTVWGVNVDPISWTLKDFTP